jgi:general secretion pathway protein J
MGTDSGHQDRVDFTSFSHRRLGFGAHESDQNELSYFLSPDPDSRKVDLARRESPYIDMDPKKGGTVLVLAYDVQSLDFQYLDPVLNEWVDSWDSTQPTGQMDRLPLQVRIELVVAGADNGAPLHYVTKVPLAMQAPLSFGLPR